MTSHRLTILDIEHHETLHHCLNEYGDTSKAYYVMAEILYWYEHRQAPPWACYIERVEFYPGGDLIIHRDPDESHA